MSDETRRRVKVGVAVTRAITVCKRGCLCHTECMNYQLFFPILGMFVLTVAVTINMAVVRLRAIRNREVDLKYFKVYEGSAPEKVIVASRHFTNLFEVPVLFYAGAVVGMVINIGSAWALIWAWLFVAARVAHALVHLTSNKTMWRMRMYMLSWVALVGFWIVLTMEIVSRA